MVIQNVHLNCMGLYSVGEEAYLRGISGFRSFTRVCGMSESKEGPKNNLLMCFFVGTTLVGAI